MKLFISLFAQLIRILGDFRTWIIPWILLSIGYYGILKKTGLKKYLAVIPALAERELSKVLFCNLRAYFRAAVFSLACLGSTFYLDTFYQQSLNAGYLFFIAALFAYGFYMIKLYWRLGKAFDKGVLFRIGMILCPPVFLIILGWGRSSFKQGPVFRRAFIKGRHATFFVNAVATFVVAAELVVVTVGLGLVSARVRAPRLLVMLLLDDFAKSTENITANDEQVVTRELSMGDAAASVAQLPVSREKYFPDHSGDESVVVMEYIVGSNLETGFGAATANINEMIDATKQGDKLTFVLEAGGSLRWFTDGIEDKTVGRYTVNNGKIEKVLDIDRKTTMSSSDELRNFITWTKENYPADRYMLVLWDHGGGLSTGFGQDEMNPGKDNPYGLIEVSGIVSALEQADVKFDAIGFDACLMQDIEVAYMLEPYADYYIASEEVEGGYGWFYTPAFGLLAQNPGVSTEEFGKALIGSFDELNTVLHNGQPDSQSTLALVDLTLAKPVYDSVLEMYGKEKEAIEESPASYADISIAVKNAYTFENDEQVDLVDYLEKLKQADFDQKIMTQQEYDDLINQVKACVIYRNADSAEGVHGMALTFPYESYQAYTDVYNQYLKLSMERPTEFYNEFFSVIAYQHKDDKKPEFLEYLSPTVDLTQEEWYVNGFEDYVEDIKRTDIPLEKTEEGYAAALPESTWQIISEQKHIAYLKDSMGLKYLGRDNIGDLDENGRLLIPEDNKWVHISGIPVCYEAGAERVITAGVIHSGTTKALLNGKEEVVIHIEWSAMRPEFEGDPVGRITGYHSAYDENPYTAKGLKQFNSGDSIQFIYSFTDETGALIAENPDGSAVTMVKPGSLKVEYSQLKDPVVLHSIYMQDVYQRELFTEITEIENTGN